MSERLANTPSHERRPRESRALGLLLFKDAVEEFEGRRVEVHRD